VGGADGRPLQWSILFAALPMEMKVTIHNLPMRY
jgi:hypothetical protein